MLLREVSGQILNTRVSETEENASSSSSSLVSQSPIALGNNNTEQSVGVIGNNAIVIRDNSFAINSPVLTTHSLYINPIRGVPLADLTGFYPLLRNLTSELVYDTLNESRVLTFFRTEHLTMINDVLQTLADVSTSTPTMTSRLLYLVAMLTLTSWNAVSPSPPGPLPPTSSRFPSAAGVNITNDDWTYGRKTPLQAQDATVWSLHAIIDLLPLFVPTYNPEPLRLREASFFNWTPTEQQAHVVDVRARADWGGYNTAFNEWLTLRNNDGYVAANAFVVTTAEIPNLATPIVVTEGVDPGDSGTWTPLTLASGATQHYLGFTWNTVKSPSSLSTVEEQTVVDAASAFFNENNSVARDSEVHDVYVASASLTDAQKMSAEFWAGNPHTVTPPGMFAWLWADYVRHYLPTDYRSTSGETDAHVVSFFHLAVNLFEASRLCWKIKSTYIQSRPIQEVRHRFRGTIQPSPITGNPIDASVWVPYQPAFTVTPRFADFCSGHSYFSACFAGVMTYWFGPNVAAATLPVLSANYTNLSLLSSLFSTASARDAVFGVFAISAGVSDVQPGVTPASSFTLDWSGSTWAQLATDVGYSRFYGGIHALSAHNGSSAAAVAQIPVVQAAWNITNYK